MTAPKAAPCPICGSIYTEVYAYENGWQHVECDECYYLGPGEGSKLQAVRSHNDRLRPEQDETRNGSEA